MSILRRNSIGPLQAFANVAASQTDSSVVAAVSGKVIVVTGFITKAGGTATTIVFNSKPAGAGSAISATFANGANGDTTGVYNPDGWFRTTRGEGLSVTTGTGSTTGIQITYTLE